MESPVVLPSVAFTPKPEDIRSEFDLPFSGKHVIILRGTGRDKRLALMSAGPGADEFRILDAVTARLCLIDGKRIKMEDVDNLDFDDSLALTQEVGKLLRPLTKVKAVAPATDATEANDSQLSS